MKKITGNEPINHPHRYRMGDEYEGLTIRQYYAVIIFQGLISDADHHEKDMKRMKYKSIIEMSILYADALIAELNKSEPE